LDVVFNFNFGSQGLFGTKNYMTVQSMEKNMQNYPTYFLEATICRALLIVWQEIRRTALAALILTAKGVYFYLLCMEKKLVWKT
jgi:hypothetical protein